jgi:hypothetical protein
MTIMDIPIIRSLLLSVLVLLIASNVSANEDFEKHIRPLLLKHCISCHGPDKQKAGLRLDSKSGWKTGGDSGPALLPGEPDKSLLIKAIRGEVGLERMPPKEKLSEQEIALLTKWIKDGAIDPRDGGPVRIGGTTMEEARKWWSFQPVRRPMVPDNRCDHPIDAFITAKLSNHQLSLSPKANKRTLIRRATYDLIGLPPTNEEVDAFLKDESQHAFEKVIDRLLASPHYGERWGRHWLDLVRYADTAGENSDHPLPHAWRYRNWVIDAINLDQPYDSFLRDQIAGDILAAKGPPEQFASRTIATGYLAIARRFDHDSDKFMHLTHEDGIDTLGKAFLGLTIGCARCHDHKYDAITARDYYALYGIFDSTKFAFPGCEAKQQPRDMVPLMPQPEWDRVVKPHLDRLSKIDAEIRAKQSSVQEHAQRIQESFTKARTVLSTGECPESGEKQFDVAGEVDVKVGEIILLSVTPLKNHGADTTLLDFQIDEIGGQQRKWNATADLLEDFLSGNPHADHYDNKLTWCFFDTRNQPTLLPEALRDHSGKVGLNLWRNGDTPVVLVNRSHNEVDVWTKLPPRSLFAHPGLNGNVAVGWLSPIAGKVKVSGRLKDVHTGGPDGVGWVLERFATDIRSDLVASAAAKNQVDRLNTQKQELLQNAPKKEVAYAVKEGNSADAHLHLRGDPEKLGDPVPRRWLEIFGAMPINSKTGSGRLDLANWITSESNPLTARVMVNRIWQHHFGKGIVQSPNDFGTRGLAPTHPELLDWLASKFVDSGWSLKDMHRMIMRSATYQQASADHVAAKIVDANNNLYWKFDRRRLSAEELRDSLLLASSQLDRKPAESHPFPPESTWGYTQHVPFSTFFESDKRSVYLVNVRNRRHPFLGLFDGADPNATTPQRQTTTVPTQALYFLNDAFFHAHAEKVANHLLTKPESERIEVMFRLTLQRSPTDHDRKLVLSFHDRYHLSVQATSANTQTQQAWATLTRIILASNEFLFVE